MLAPLSSGGVRGTYKTYRQVLDTFHPSTDVPEATISARDAEVLSEEPSAGVAVAPAAVVKEEAVDIAQARWEGFRWLRGWLWAGQPFTAVGVTLRARVQGCRRFEIRMRDCHAPEG